MAKKERAPKKEKPTKREKEILKRSAAERRENRKSNGLNALITVIVVVLLIGVSTVVGLVVKDKGQDPTDNQTTEQERDRVWLLNLLKDYDGTVAYLTEKGYTAGADFEASYDAAKAETSDGLVGIIKMTDASGYFEIYYFAETTDATASKNAQTYYNVNIASRMTADENLNGRNSGINCFLGKGDTFENLFWKYFKIN